MDKIYSNSTYEYVKKLEEKLTTLKGKIDENIYDSYSEEITNIKKQLINLPDSPNLSLIKPIIERITELEFKFESELGKSFKEVVRQSILMQLNIVEGYIAKDLKMVEEIIGKISRKLEEVRDVYDNVEYDQIEEKLLKIIISCNIERARIKGKISRESIEMLFSDNGYTLLRNIIAIKGQEASGLEKAIIESWQTEIADVNTGLIDKTKLRTIVSNPKFWSILSGVKEVTQEDNKTLNEVNTSAKKDYATRRREYIEQIASEYGFKPQQLKVGSSEVLSIVEVETFAGKIKYKICKEKLLKWQKREHGQKAVAYIFADDIREIDSDYKDHINYKLRDIVLPSKLRFIRHDVFKNSSIESIDFPDELEIIGQNAFSDCRRLKILDFNDKLEQIWIRAFGRCEKLEIVNFNYSLNSISSYAFLGTKIKNVILSDKVEVGREAFPDDCIIERIPDKDEKTEVKIQNSDNKVTTDNRNRRGSIDR